MAAAHAERISALAAQAFVPSIKKKGRIRVKKVAAEALFKSFEKYTKTASWKSSHGSGRPEDWEDLSQECLLGLWAMFQKKGAQPYGFEPATALKLKTKNILSNRYKSFKRGAGREIPHDFGPAPEHHSLHLSTPATAFAGAERRELVQHALAVLTPTERSFVEAWVEEDGTTLRIARRLGIHSETCQRFEERVFAKMRASVSQ